jgi:hypothetical protein
MNRLRTFGAFLYDFVIGDDPLVAAVIVIALGVTALIASGGTAAWWVMPAAAIGALAFSLHRATETTGVPPVSQKAARRDAGTEDRAAGA